MLKGIEFLRRKSRGFKTSSQWSREESSVAFSNKVVDSPAWHSQQGVPLKNDVLGLCRGRWFGVCCESVKRMYHSGSSANELTLKAKDDVSGFGLKYLLCVCCKFFKYPSPGVITPTSPSGGEVLNSVLSTSAFDVILRRYSLPEVPRRRIHNVIAHAMSMFNDTPHSALKRHSLPQGAREEKSVAFGNKVMDTRLPLPVGSGDKYDVDGLGYRLLRRYTPRNDGASNGEGVLRPWCQKILGTGPSMTGAKGANSFGRSMIEMLGVLAIIAVLSVGGIAGYSKAMSSYKHDKWRQQVEELLFNTKDSYKNEKTYKSATGDVLSTLKTIGAVPQGMLDVTNRDLFGNTFSIYAEEWLSFLRIRMVVETMPSQDAVQVCQDLYGLLPAYNDFIWTIVAGCSSGNCGGLFFMRLCGNAMPADYFDRYGHECQNAADKAYIAQSCTKCKEEKCFIWVFFDNRT